MREVLSGQPVAAVARRASVDPALLHRWVIAFVDAGTAQVTNRPDPAAAHQRDRFLAAFAHELRTPLAVATGWAALLDDDLEPEELADTVLRLQSALTRLTERTKDVELLAAASLGRLRVRPQLVRVEELAPRPAPDRTAAGDDRVPVGGLGPGAELLVDPDLFRRVLRDLWEAGHALPAPRSVRLEVHDVDPWWELRVVRDADPIDPAVLQALFEPFDLNDDDSGVTIGLYLARALTVAHAGTIGVDQDERSATLWVRVPRRPESSSGRASTEPADPATKKG